MAADPRPAAPDPAPAPPAPGMGVPRAWWGVGGIGLLLIVGMGLLWLATRPGPTPPTTAPLVQSLAYQDPGRRDPERGRDERRHPDAAAAGTVCDPPARC